MGRIWTPSQQAITEGKQRPKSVSGTVIGALCALIGIVIGGGGVVGYWKFFYEVPLIEHGEIIKSLDSAIRTAEELGDDVSLEDLRRRKLKEEEAFLATRAILSRVAPYKDVTEPISPDANIQEIGDLLEASEPLLAATSTDYLARSHAFLLIGAYDKAIRNADTALTLRDDFEEAKLVRATALLRARRFDHAIQAYDDLLSTAAQSAEALVGRAAALIGLRRYAEALVDTEQALQLHHAYASAVSKKVL